MFAIVRRKLIPNYLLRDMHMMKNSMMAQTAGRDGKDQNHNLKMRSNEDGKDHWWKNTKILLLYAYLPSEGTVVFIPKGTLFNSFILSINLLIEAKIKIL